MIMEVLINFTEIIFKSIYGFLLRQKFLADSVTNKGYFEKMGYIILTVFFCAVLLIDIFYFGMYRKLALTDTLKTPLWQAILLNLFFTGLYFSLFVMSLKSVDTTKTA